MLKTGSCRIFKCNLYEIWMNIFIRHYCPPSNPEHRLSVARYLFSADQELNNSLFFEHHHETPARLRLAVAGVNLDNGEIHAFEKLHGRRLPLPAVPQVGCQSVVHCAHRTSTFLSCAFCEQEGHLAAPPHPSKLVYFTSLGMALVVVQLRTSSEHIPIVRAPGARDHVSAIPSSPLESSS